MMENKADFGSERPLNFVAAVEKIARTSNKNQLKKNLNLQQSEATHEHLMKLNNM
jgi:hypothetical protein